MRALAAVALCACSAHAPPPARLVPDAGITISLYSDGKKSFSVLDDRRFLSITGATVELDRIDPGAALASLVIESDGALRIDHCTRDRLPEPERSVKEQIESPPALDRYMPTVRCAVQGPPGRYLVRILYVSDRLTYRADHDVAMTSPEHATISSRFAVETPSWRQPATAIIFDGVPGGERPPKQLARGTIQLDGSTAILAVPVREVAAQLRRIYDGAIIYDAMPPTDPGWGRDSQQTVWVWLELADAKLPRGMVHAHVELPNEPVQDFAIPDPVRKADRFPLWIDYGLQGMRQRFDLGDNAERFLFTVSNLGDTARDVFIDEHPRPARHRSVERAWPSKPTFTGEVLRTKLRVTPGKLERTGYTLVYDF